MSREKDLAKNTGILMLGTCLPKIAAFIVLPVLTGQLTKEEYGTYDLITIMVTLFLPAATLQLQTAAFRFLIDCREDKGLQQSIVSTIFAFTVPVSIVALSALFIFLDDLDIIIRTLICIYYFVDVICNTIRQSMRGLGNNAVYSISAIISSLMQLILALILIQGWGLGLFGAVCMLTVSESISLIYLIVKSKIYQYIHLSSITANQLKKCLQYSFPLVPNYMAMWVMRLSNRIAITFFMGISANALFAAAYKIPQILTLLQNTFSMAWQENASLTKDADDANIYYEKMFDRIFALLAGFLTTLLAVSPFLFALLIQGEYEESFFQVPLIIIAIFLYCLCSYMGGIYVAYMKTANVGVTTICAAILNIVLCIALIPPFGLYGASLAMIISFLALFLFRFFHLRTYKVHLRLDAKIAISLFIVTAIQMLLLNQRTLLYDCVGVALALPYCYAINRESLKAIFKAIVKRLTKKG